MVFRVTHQHMTLDKPHPTGVTVDARGSCLKEEDILTKPLVTRTVAKCFIGANSANIGL